MNVTSMNEAMASYVHWQMPVDANYASASEGVRDLDHLLGGGRCGDPLSTGLGRPSSVPGRVGPGIDGEVARVYAGGEAALPLGPTSAGGY